MACDDKRELRAVPVAAVVELLDLVHVRLVSAVQASTLSQSSALLHALISYCQPALVSGRIYVGALVDVDVQLVVGHE